MKVHKEGTGLLRTLFTILFIVNITLYHTVGKGMLFYSVAFVSTVLFLLVLNFFRSPFRRFPYDSEGLVIAPADGTIVAIEEVMENDCRGDGTPHRYVCQAGREMSCGRANGVY